MSHDNHISDVHGTYNANCPDCNTPWLQAVRAVIALHRPSHGIAGTFCSHCKTGNRQQNAQFAEQERWPCPTIHALGNLPDVPEEPRKPKPDDAGLTRCRTRLFPSALELCGYYLIGGLCVRHGRDTGI